MRHGRFGFLGIRPTLLLMISYDKIPQRRGLSPFFARFSYDFRAHKKSTAAAVPLCFSAYTIAHVVCEIL